MLIRRLAAAGGVIAVGALFPTLPAWGHGAPTTPVSRTAACAAGGGTATGAPACRAARRANGGPFGTFDNLRVPNVNGDDRKFVPDGELCSGGLDAFHGLDLARDDFPATKVTGGRTLAIRYRATLPHEGSFRIYLTRPGYDPRRKLTWADLGGRPIAEVTGPPLRDGAYLMSARLPQRTGRHILYIVWQTSSTVDTYYSCSDLIFPAAARPSETSAEPPPRRSPARATASATPDSTAAAPAATTGPARAQQITHVGDQSRFTPGNKIIAGALLVAFALAAWAGIGRLLRNRRGNR